MTIGSRASVLAFATFLTLALALQWAGGAFQSEFGSFTDESAHYVTSLMIHDWVSHGFPWPPMEFAKNYYFHYPRVALGVWPPFFHSLQALWMLVFSPARASVLVFMAFITASLAMSLFRTIRAEYSSALAGLSAGALLICFPAVQKLTDADMADSLVALLDLWAVLSLIRYLDRERARDALWFGWWTALSLMTKQNGAALAVVALLAIALSGRWRLLLRPPLWYAAGIAILLAGPWEYFVLQFDRRNLLIQNRSPGFGAVVLLQYAKQLYYMVGTAVLIAAAFGIWDKVLSRRRSGTVEVRWATWTAFAAGILLFHAFLPGAIAEPRYLIAELPAWIVLGAAGVAWLAGKLPDRLPQWQRNGMVAAGTVILCALQIFGIPRKPTSPLRQAAEDLLRSPDAGDMYLVSSTDGAREGAFVAEVAMDDIRPTHVVLRAGKLLAISNWLRDHYDLVYDTPEKVQAYLISLPISAIVIEGSDEFLPHHKMLRAMVRQFPDSWKPLAQYPGVEVYRRIGPQPPATGTIRLNMQYSLGYTLDR